MDQRFCDLWLIAETTDLALHEAFITHGVQGVINLLKTSDVLEHNLCRLAADLGFSRTGDKRIGGWGVCALAAQPGN